MGGWNILGSLKDKQMLLFAHEQMFWMSSEFFVKSLKQGSVTSDQTCNIN